MKDESDSFILHPSSFILLFGVFPLDPKAQFLAVLLARGDQQVTALAARVPAEDPVPAGDARMQARLFAGRRLAQADLGKHERNKVTAVVLSPAEQAGHARVRPHLGLVLGG